MDIGLQVRCGLNVGQVETNDGKPTGAAVVAAARIMSSAGDGEVLVSNLLRELIPGSKIEFADAGMHELKGPRRLVAPVPGRRGRRSAVGRRTTRRGVGGPPDVDRRLDGDGRFVREPDDQDPRRSRRVPGPRRGHRVPQFPRPTLASSTIAPNSIGILDLESGDLSGTIDLGERPGSVAASADGVWVTNPDVGTVTRIDPSEQEVSRLHPSRARTRTGSPSGKTQCGS